MNARAKVYAELIASDREVRRGTKMARLSVEVHLDQLLEEIGELVFAAAMKGATPFQLRETVLSQISREELRTFIPLPRGKRP